MNSEFKNLFSQGSSDYQKFRPRYPNELFIYLASLTPEHQLAWDCATGNGQAALPLTKYFKQVIATDPAEAQLARAPRHAQIEYRVALAEKSNLADASVDLVTVAQAFHWFQAPEFFAEAKRVLKPNGVLAFWCYSLAQVTPEVDAVVMHYYRDILGEYWEKERRLVDEGYQFVHLPLAEVQPPAFAMSARWTLEHWIGYLGTWSALATYIKRNSTNPLEELYPRMKAAWGSPHEREVHWPLHLRVGRNST